VSCRSKALALAAILALTGCTASPMASPVPVGDPSITTAPVHSQSATPTTSPGMTTPSSKPSSKPTPKPPATAPAKDTRRGSQLNTPYTVSGIPVISKEHRITAAYAPRNPSGTYHLESTTAAALAKMTAAAQADGVRIRVHSGYRNWASQDASYQRAKRNYPQSLSFYAPAGASEHQTGLAVDLWDGVTWSLPMARTATGKWLFAHAHSYGFVLRYPNGKTKITGYHYEPWHYRYIGKADAMQFKGNSLTLEEYLGLA